VKFACCECGSPIVDHVMGRVVWLAGGFYAGKRLAKCVMLVHVGPCCSELAERVVAGKYGECRELGSLPLVSFDGSGDRVATVRQWNHFTQADVLRLREIDFARHKYESTQRRERSPWVRLIRGLKERFA